MKFAVNYCLPAVELHRERPDANDLFYLPICPILAPALRASAREQSPLAHPFHPSAGVIRSIGQPVDLLQECQGEPAGALQGGRLDVFEIV